MNEPLDESVAKVPVRLTGKQLLDNGLVLITWSAMDYEILVDGGRLTKVTSMWTSLCPPEHPYALAPMGYEDTA